MKYLELRNSVAGLLRGDNSKANETLIQDDTFLKMAIRDISLRCVPSRLVTVWDDTKTDVFRRLASDRDTIYDDFAHSYIRMPVIDITDDGEVDMNNELIQPLILYMCHYLSNKKEANYSKQADEAISFYESTSVDVNRYDLHL